MKSIIIKRKRSRNRPSYNTHSYIKYGMYIIKTVKWKEDSIKTILPRHL